jgi:hypothetical protein
MVSSRKAWSRREVIQAAAAAAVPVVSESTPARAADTKRRTPRKLVGIQVGAISFVDEGVDAVLDILQERAAVNAIFLATFTYGRGIAGRQIPGQPLPDHGRQEYDRNFRGGNYATPHPEFYRNTVLKDVRAPDHGNLDILEAVLPRAQRRGVRVFAWAEDVWRGDVPNIEQVHEVDLHGRRRGTLCLRNPDYRFFLEGLVQDYAKSYPIDGVMWGSERQGPLFEAIGASHGGGGNAARVGCFCSFCREEARRRGIQVERAVQGYTALERYVRLARTGSRPRDGYFVEFWRTLMRYPEILAWEKLWSDGQHESYRYIYDAAKAVRRDVSVGYHIWHLNSFSPFFRAEQDYGALARYADYLKVVLYNNCGGPRLAGYVRSLGRTLFGDLGPEETLRLHYRVLNYEEKPLAELPRSGLSADYVFRETRRAREAVGSKTNIYPGIDIDVPTGRGQKQTTPRDVSEAVGAAFRGGADGVILSRKYSEMRLANLSGAGAGLRAAGVLRG